MLADLLLAIPFVLVLGLIVRDMRVRLLDHCRRQGDTPWRVLLGLPEAGR